MQNWSITQARQQRAAERAAAAAGREARGEEMALDFGGDQPVVVGAEFPITTLAPLRAMDEEMGLLVKKALDIVQARGAEDEQREATQLIIELLVLTPDLPTKLLDIIHEIGVNLLTEQGMADFLAARPSGQDVISLVTTLLDWWGLSLGEALGSSESSTSDGGTSSPTSPDSTPDSTPDEPSSPQETAA